MNLRQAAQQALEVLENSRSLEPVDVDWVKGKRKAVIATLRAALAEPNKCTHGVADGSCKECYMAEPVAWMEMVVANLVREGINKHKARELAHHFATPPQRKPLTEEELEVLWDDATDRMEHFCSQYWDFARAIEAAHGIGEKHE